MNRVLLMMGGSGTRFGADIPKQFILIEGIPVFAYIMKGYDECDFIDDITVVVHKDWEDYVREWEKRLGVSKIYKVTPGGETRSESVFNGLKALKDNGSDKDVILIHDATHPYVDKQGSKDVIEAVKKYGGATLGQGQYDTVYQMDEENHMLQKVVPRRQIVSGASPESFFYGEIYDISENTPREDFEKMTSAGAIALANGIDMKVITSGVLNLKITYKNDMDVFRRMVHEYFPGSENWPKC